MVLPVQFSHDDDDKCDKDAVTGSVSVFGEVPGESLPFASCDLTFIPYSNQTRMFDRPVSSDNCSPEYVRNVDMWRQAAVAKLGSIHNNDLTVNANDFVLSFDRETRHNGGISGGENSAKPYYTSLVDKGYLTITQNWNDPALFTAELDKR